MTEATRQFYGSIALLFVFIAGVFGGALWGRGYDGAYIFAKGLLVAGVLFGWVATRDSGAKKAPK